CGCPWAARASSRRSPRWSPGWRPRSARSARAPYSTYLADAPPIRRSGMRPGFGQFNVATPEYLQFAAQFGATDVLFNTPLLPGGARWELYDLVKLRLSVEQWGLKL